MRISREGGVKDWTSPALGLRFVLTSETLAVYYPDGRRFLTMVECSQRAEQAQQRADRLAAQWKALGVNQDEI